MILECIFETLKVIVNGDVLLIFRGRSLLGYHKRDIALQSSYCMIHFDDIPVLQTLHSDCKCSLIQIISMHHNGQQVFPVKI